MRPPAEMELTQPYWAYLYAKDVIKGRWPEGEPVIAREPVLACGYALCVIQGRFPKGEPAIARDPHSTKDYLNAFPEAKLEWVLNGLMDWTDL